MLRTCYGLVIEKEKDYVDNPEDCYNIFSKYYPNKKKEAKEVLKIAKKPVTDKEKVFKIIDTFGKWLTKEYKKQI